MNKVVLIGISHSIQRGDLHAEKYKSYIKDLCNTYHIKAIAEEIDNNDTYIASDISSKLSIEHKIIEPTEEEKKDLDILTLNEIDIIMHNKYLLPETPTDEPRLQSWPNSPTEDNLPSDIFEEFDRMRQYTFRQRESEWLKRIKELNIWPVLVICGADHYQPFKDLLSENSIDIIKENNGFCI